MVNNEALLKVRNQGIARTLFNLGEHGPRSIKTSSAFNHTEPLPPVILIGIYQQLSYQYAKLRLTSVRLFLLKVVLTFGENHFVNINVSIYKCSTYCKLNINKANYYIY